LVKQNPATILALLMFLASTVDQMMRRCRRLFRHARSGIRTAYTACRKFSAILRL